MAFDVLDEHEQGELVQKWLRENALSIVVGVGLGLVLIFGWQQWRGHRNAHRLDAATQYQVFSDDLGKKDIDGARAIAGKLQSDYADTPYAVLSAMRLASDAAAQGDAAAANAALQDAYAHAGIGALKTLAGLNLARSEIAQNKAQDALALLDKLPEDGYAALRDELRGDALSALGHSADARHAYTEALTHLDANAANRAFVQMKLDNLAGVEKKGS
ncbi:MAG: tetratricopeptide repeat protein [Proteobacteria bacterium]|nr:tetratricopeptide repeat protein [Pseudomonadota bacterium]